MEDNLAVAVNYEKCRVLVQLVGDAKISASDRETLAWIVEEYFAKLGDAIEKSQKK